MEYIILIVAVVCLAAGFWFGHTVGSLQEMGKYARQLDELRRRLK